MIPAKIISDNEQDRAEAESWWKHSTHEEKSLVWMRIQRHYDDDPAMEIMSRLAQLAFGELTEKLGL